MKDFIDSIKARDLAARNAFQILLLYPGVQAYLWYKAANYLYKRGLRFLPEWIMYVVRSSLNIEIHPAAKIGKRLFIDHGTGLVIGATAVVGDDVTIYHGVTLGAVGKGAVPGAKRHPTVEDGVVIGAGAKILGDITLGKGCYVGANAVVRKDVPPGATAVGVPAVTKK
ncbi:MAG: serine acetyltransferase [Turicibacter sp.]|nr:serine acetyltransferase [Turicibacter sp.]